MSVVRGPLSVANEVLGMGHGVRCQRTASQLGNWFDRQLFNGLQFTVYDLTN